MRTLFVVSVLLLAAAPATGQVVTSDWFAQSATQRTVYVTTDDGTEAVGRLLRIDASSLTIRERSQERTFERDDVLFVDRRGDSLRNGAVIGAITGVGLGLLEGTMSDCGGLAPRDCTAGETARFVALMTGVSAAAGIGIDALIRGRTRMYRSARAARPTATTLAPLVHRRAAGLALSVSWR